MPEKDILAVLQDGHALQMEVKHYLNAQIPVLKMMDIPENRGEIVEHLKVDEKRFKDLGALWDEDMKSLKYLEVLLLS